MSNYTKSTNFATKDNLPTGDPLKIVKGTEIDTEYNNIATAIATKTDNSAAAITGGTIAGVTVTSSNATITGGSITGITDLAIADGGTGASTAANAINNLLPSQTGNASKYLQSDGTNPFWDAISLSTADITGTLGTANGGTGSTSTTFANLTTNVTGTLPVANGGTGVTSSTGSGNNVLSTSPTLVTPVLGTPTSATLTNATGLPLSTGISGLGTGVATALAINTPNIGAMVVNGGALGTPSSGVVTNLTGTANININGLVGVTTANNGNFTSINASSTVNLSAGTVDGVLYLDASKNITTGTVLSFSGIHLTSNRTVSTTYSATDFTTYPNGFILQNSATPATGLFNSIYFKNNGNMQNVFGVVQNSSGYGDFVWAGFSGSYAEAMRLTSSGLSVTGTVGATSGFNGTIGAGTTNTGAFTTISSTEGLALATSSSGDVFYIGQAPNRVFINAGATDNFIRSQTGALGLYAAGATTFAGGIQIISGGNVGINVSNPTNKLDVGGTLGVSGAVTLSGGTANGVTFLNGSKVLTSGSALTFDGTRLGIGTASPDSLGLLTTEVNGNGLNISRTASTTGRAGWLSQNTAETIRLFSEVYGASATNTGFGLTLAGYGVIQAQGTASNGLIIGTATNDPLIFGQNDTEGMRLTSTGLGIGTSTPDVFSRGYSGKTVGISSASGETALMVNSSGTNVVAFEMGRGGTRSTLLYDTTTSTEFGTLTSKPLAFITNATERMRLDSAGNLGLGVTPSAWLGVDKALQVGGTFSGTTRAGALTSQTNDAVTTLWNNAYRNASVVETYFADGEASKYKMNRNAHEWHVAASGTAGNPISFTQAMTLDANGALIVGNTSARGEKATFESSTIGSANIGIVQIRSTKAADSGDCLLAIVKQANDDSTSQVFVRFGINGYAQGCGQINANGASQAAFGSFSDYRLKENIESLPSQLSNIMALRPVEFDYKNGSGHQVGFIAQEMEQVYPDAIGIGEDEMLTITGWSKTEARLVKAMQEQQAIIESLKARLDAANL